MISLLSLLLAGLTDGGETVRTRARAHELRGRLGLKTTRRPSDLRMRVAYAWQGKTQGEKAALLYVLWLLEHYEPDPPDWWIDEAAHGYHEAEIDVHAWVTSVLEHTDPYGRPMQGFSEGNADLLRLMLPPEGLRSRYEPYVAWFADNITLPQGRAEDITDFLEFDGIDHPLTLILMHIADWAETEGADLGRLTFFDAMAEAEIWHDRLGGSPSYREPVAPAVRVVTWPDGAHIDRLVTRAQLAAEGTSMGHCVGGPVTDGVAPGTGRYYQRNRDGTIVLLSYRDEQDVPQATVEIDITEQPRVVQIQGPDDGPIEDEEAQERLAWLLVKALKGVHIGGHAAQLGVRPYLTGPTRSSLLSAESSLHDGLWEIDQVREEVQDLREEMEELRQLEDDEGDELERFVFEFEQDMHMEPADWIHEKTVELFDFKRGFAGRAVALMDRLDQALQPFGWGISFSHPEAVNLDSFSAAYRHTLDEAEFDFAQEGARVFWTVRSDFEGTAWQEAVIELRWDERRFEPVWTVTAHGKTITNQWPIDALEKLEVLLDEEQAMAQLQVDPPAGGIDLKPLEPRMTSRPRDLLLPTSQFVKLYGDGGER